MIIDWRSARSAPTLINSRSTIQGYAGPVKFAVAGPWTLAAMMERPRGDKVLADHGARRDLGQSLAEGVAQLIMEMRRRLPDIEPLVQLDEPLLPSVLAGEIPTASGFSRHRVVDIPEVSAMISQLVERLQDTSATPTAVHCCAAAAPIELLWKAGASTVLVDLAQLTSRDWDAIGPAMEAGLRLGAGALPTDRSVSRRRHRPDGAAAAARHRHRSADRGRTVDHHPGLRAGRVHPRRRHPCPAGAPYRSGHRDRPAGGLTGGCRSRAECRA